MQRAISRKVADILTAPAQQPHILDALDRPADEGVAFPRLVHLAGTVRPRLFRPGAGAAMARALYAWLSEIDLTGFAWCRRSTPQLNKRRTICPVWQIASL